MTPKATLVVQSAAVHRSNMVNLLHLLAVGCRGANSWQCSKACGYPLSLQLAIAEVRPSSRLDGVVTPKHYGLENSA